MDNWQTPLPLPCPHGLWMPPDAAAAASSFLQEVSLPTTTTPIVLRDRLNGAISIFQKIGAL